MNTLLNRIIQLNVELEGTLRVAVNRPSEEALDSAKKKFAEISALFAMLTPASLIASDEEQRTEIKAEEAEGGETAPQPEPDVKDVNDDSGILKEIEATESETTIPAPKHKEPVDIRKIFTLNDKFLFKRVLFDNNEAEFNDTLLLFSSMQSFDEIEEYVYDDLRWDSTDAHVRDFMNIVRTHFSENA